MLYCPNRHTDLNPEAIPTNNLFLFKCNTFNRIESSTAPTKCQNKNGNRGPVPKQFYTAFEIQWQLPRVGPFVWVRLKKCIFFTPCITGLFHNVRGRLHKVDQTYKAISETMFMYMHFTLVPPMAHWVYFSLVCDFK